MVACSFTLRLFVASLKAKGRNDTEEVSGKGGMKRASKEIAQPCSVLQTVERSQVPSLLPARPGLSGRPREVWATSSGAILHTFSAVLFVDVFIFN